MCKQYNIYSGNSKKQALFYIYTIHNCSYDGQCTEKITPDHYTHKIHIWNNRAVHQIGNNTNFGGFIVFWVIIIIIMQTCQVK